MQAWIGSSQFCPYTHTQYYSVLLKYILKCFTLCLRKILSVCCVCVCVYLKSIGADAAVIIHRVIGAGAIILTGVGEARLTLGLNTDIYWTWDTHTCAHKHTHTHIPLWISTFTYKDQMGVLTDTQTAAHDQDSAQILLHFESEHHLSSWFWIQCSQTRSFTWVLVFKTDPAVADQICWMSPWQCFHLYIMQMWRLQVVNKVLRAGSCALLLQAKLKFPLQTPDMDSRQRSSQM